MMLDPSWNKRVWISFPIIWAAAPPQKPMPRRQKCAHAPQQVLQMCPSRWLEEARILYQEHPDGLHLTYDPKLRDAVIEGSKMQAMWMHGPCLRR